MRGCEYRRSGAEIPFGIELRQVFRDRHGTVIPEPLHADRESLLAHRLDARRHWGNKVATINTIEKGRSE